MSRALDVMDVLHVDDEPDLAELAATFLEREDARIEVSTASDPQTGLDVLNSENVNCIVSDYDMPGMNGIEFLETVRDEYPDIPFILFTGKGSEEVASNAISAGVTDYLQKETGTDQYAVLANRIVNAVTAERAQRQRRRQLDAIESAQEGISILDGDGHFIYVNETYADLYGYEPEEMIGNHWELIYRIEDIQHIYEDVLPIVEETGYWHGTTTGLRSDGTTFVEDHVFTETDAGELVCTVRDVTARRERERELERTRELLEQTERVADVGGWEIDPDTREVFWTEHLYEILGVDFDEEPPLDEALDIYHEEDRPIVEEAVQNALESGDSFSVEARFSRPDGELRWLRIQGTPTVVDGEVVTLRGAVQDITDRRTRERVLRDLYNIISDRRQSFDDQVKALLELGREQLDTAYGTLSEIRGEEYVFEIVATDDDSIQSGDVVPVSATNCELVASDEGTLVLGDVERDAPQETDRAGFTDWGISCYIGAPVYVGEDVYGTFCFYDTEARSGQFSEWETTLVDLMSRWVSYELDRRAANRRLRETNEQLEEFAGIVSHDLRNPLNIAEGNLELVAEDCESEHLDSVKRAHDRMGSLIEDLLALTSAGGGVGELEAIDVVTLVENSWRTVETGDATVTPDVDRTVRADRSRLQQLFENLFRNAVEHGGQDVTVTVGELSNGFYVEDDGTGVSRDSRDDVFEAGHTTSEEGTGFGLSIVNQIVDSHGWSVRVTESATGGARFEITDVEFE